jgi:hypothetical protein
MNQVDTVGIERAASLSLVHPRTYGLPTLDDCWISAEVPSTTCVYCVFLLFQFISGEGRSRKAALVIETLNIPSYSDGTIINFTGGLVGGDRWRFHRYRHRMHPGARSTLHSGPLAGCR